MIFATTGESRRTRCQDSQEAEVAVFQIRRERDGELITRRINILRTQKAGFIAPAFHFCDLSLRQNKRRPPGRFTAHAL